jgi:5-methylcytosine-specific restriction protein B
MLVNMKQDSYSEQVRAHVIAKYIGPARNQRNPTVRIVAGDVHRALGLNNRYPLVCNALSARKFLAESHLMLEQREGPPSGLGARVAFTYRLLDEKAPESETTVELPLSRYRGAAKEVFESLGGGEAFIRSQREHFYGPGDDE